MTHRSGSAAEFNNHAAFFKHIQIPVDRHQGHRQKQRLQLLDCHHILFLDVRFHLLLSNVIHNDPSML